MDRRTVLKGAGAAVAAAFTASALAADKVGHDQHDHGSHDSHDHHEHAASAKLDALMQAAGDCAQKGELCLAHCLVLLGNGEREMAACAKSVNQTIAICRALETLAGQGSPYADKLAVMAIDVCKECEDECRKHEKKHAECKACADACAACLKQCKAITA